MRQIAAVIAGLGLLAGCQGPLTLEEARAACTKQGGFLVVIHTQKITKAGVVGPEIDTPGDCIAPDKFDVAPPASNKAAPGN